MKKIIINIISQEIFEYFQINIIKFITLFIYLIIIIFLSNFLEKNIFAEYSKVILLINSFLVISSSGFTIFFFKEFEKKTKKKKLFNFLLSNYILVNFNFFFIILFFKNYLYEYNFIIKENLFFLLLNSTYTLLYLSLISKKNLGINKTSLYENLFKNFLYLVTLIVVFFIFNELILNYIFIGYVISCYFLSIILFIKNFNFLSKYKMLEFKILNNLKENFRFFSRRIKQSLVSLYIVLEIYLPVIFLTFYQKNILLADYHIVLTIYMLFSFITVNIDVNLINRFIKSKIRSSKIMYSVLNFYIISLVYVIIVSSSLLLFWNFFNLNLLNNLFPFERITILMIIFLYLFDYIFGPNHQLYVSIINNFKNYLLLCLFNIILGFSLLTYFEQNISINNILFVSILMILIRNFFLHLNLLKINLNISLLSFKNISSICLKIFR